MGAAPTTQTQPIFFLFLRYLSTCPCPLAVTLVTHVVLKQLAERAGTLSYLHALQILDFPGSVCKTSGRFCTACARNISAKRKKKKKTEQTLHDTSEAKCAERGCGPSCYKRTKHHMDQTLPPWPSSRCKMNGRKST